MQSIISIANTALMRIGVSRFIDSITSAQKEAVVFNRAYDSARRRALRRYPWSFAREMRKLNLTTLESSHWKYVYDYPADALRVFEISHNDKFLRHLVGDNSPEYQCSTINGQTVILSNVPNAYALIVRDVTDVTLFDSLFEDYLVWEVAKDIAGPLSASVNFITSAAQQAQVAYEEAMIASGDERVDDRLGIPEFVRARF